MEVERFEDLEGPFMERVQRIAWATVTTVDGRGRPRSRILHPIWEGATGWIATGRESYKARHLEANPYVSVTYWDPQQEQIYAECATAWEDALDVKRRVWELYKAAPPPLGYDPGLFWPDGPESPAFGLLELIPWRIEVSGLGNLMGQGQPLVWHSGA